MSKYRVFSGLNAGKYGPEKTPYLDTFYTVVIQLWKDQVAYSAYMFGFKNKFTFLLRAVPGIANYLLPIEETLRSCFVPAITGDKKCSEEEGALLVLPVKFSVLGLQKLCERANIELLNSNNKRIIRERNNTG